MYPQNLTNKIHYFLFSLITKKMSASNFQTETYAGFRKEFLKDYSGLELFDRLQSDHLFLNIFDFWCMRRHKQLVDNYAQRNRFLKKIIKSKVRWKDNLPTSKIVLRMLMKKNEDFDPTAFLDGDWGEYLNKLYRWKLCNEEQLLQLKPQLREPIRHLKIYADFQICN